MVRRTALHFTVGNPTQGGASAHRRQPEATPLTESPSRSRLHLGVPKMALYFFELGEEAEFVVDEQLRSYDMRAVQDEIARSLSGLGLGRDAPGRCNGKTHNH